MCKYVEIPACVSVKIEGLNGKHKSESDWANWLRKAHSSAITVTDNTFKPVSVLILWGRRAISLGICQRIFKVRARGNDQFLPALSVLTTALTWHIIFFLLVDIAGEGISKGNSCEEHFDADDKVLPACCHGAGTDFLSIDEERVGYDAAALQDGKDHSYKAATFS